MSILVLNAGSSSLKYGAFDDEARSTLLEGKIDGFHPSSGGPATAEASQAIGRVVDELARRNASPVRAVGHRIVHGGPNLRASVVIDPEVRSEIDRATELAPLHNAAALAGIKAAEAALPGIPQVAAFDTAFFATLPPAAFVYPLPWEWYESWGFRRYGFHGISHAYAAHRAGEMLGAGHPTRRIVTLHLGNGCSAAAILEGRAVDTTMGFTPADGLMMGTRPGSIDPGIVIAVLKDHGLGADPFDDAINHHSGLLGVSGISSDYRAVESAAEGGNERARLALDIFAQRVRAAVGALAATLGGLDVLVFTGGIGEHSDRLHASVCRSLDFLGVRIDEPRNRPEGDADVSTDGSSVRVLVIHAEEELSIARDMLRLLPPRP